MSRSSRSVLSCLLLSAAFAQGAPAQTNPAPAQHERSSFPLRPPEPPTDQEQFLPYWTAEVGWATEIQLRNNQASGDLAVTPFLRATDGTETALQPVIVPPRSIRMVHVNQAIAGVAPQLVNGYGSVVLRYSSPSDGSLFAMAMIHGVGHPYAFHVDPSGTLPNYTAGSREGIWWLPQATTSDYLIVTNQGRDPLQLDLAIFDSSGRAYHQSVALGPAAMNRYSVRQLVATAGLTGSFGGVKISTAAHADALNTLHFLFDPEAGFSALLKMFNHNPNTQIAERDFAQTGLWTLRAPMLPLSSPDPGLGFPPGTVLQPQLFIRNTTANPVDANLTFRWRNAGATGQAAGPSLHLAPNQTLRLDVGALRDGAMLPKDANWTSVTLASNGPPRGLMAVAASYDSTLAHGAQTPFSDQLAAHWVGSLWEYDSQHNSFITVGNGGPRPAQAAFTIYYDPGAQKYEMLQTLQPGQQMWVDVGQLISQHVPDKNGNVLPAGLSSGTYEIWDLANRARGALFEGKVVYDKTYGHATYGCMGCCGPKTPSFTFDFNPLSIPLGGIVWQGVQAYDSCALQYDDWSDYFDGSWSTASPSIATVDYYGNHYGVGVGATTSSASAWLNVESTTEECPYVNIERSGTDNVPPNITGISPSQGPVGMTASVTINGNGFGTSPSVSAGTGITVTVSSATNTQIQASFNVSSSAPAGNHSVTVTASGQTSNSVNFFVQVPTSLSIVPGTDHTTPETGCTTSGGLSGCGVTRTFMYQVNDQSGQPIQVGGMAFGDIICNTSTNQLNLQGYATTCGGMTSSCWGTSGPCSQVTNSSGQFQETITVCAPACKPSGVCTTAGQTIANVTWYVNGQALSSDVKAYSYQCNKVLVNGQ
jgi:hypothetical protein